MVRSENIDKLWESLVAAQAEIKNLERDRKVKVTTRSGSEYFFSYATLAAVIEAVRAPLTNNGLWFTQNLIEVEGKFRLETTLIHRSGQMMSSTWPLFIGAEGNQAFGSALTFMKRYALTAMLGIAADEDDDANTAEGNEVQVQDRKPKPPAPNAMKEQPNRTVSNTVAVATDAFGLPPGNTGQKDWLEWGSNFITLLNNCKVTKDVDTLINSSNDDLEKMRKEAPKVRQRIAANVSAAYDTMREATNGTQQTAT